MRWFTQLSIAAIASASVFLALASLTPARSSHLDEAEAPADSEANVRKDLSTSTRIFAEGTVEGARREISLRFEVPGRIQALNVREGAAVKTGDVLAELDPELAELQLAESQTRLKIAVAERDSILRTLGGRNQPPLSTEEKTIAEEKVTLAEAAVKREQLLIDKTRLRAPTDGIILRAAAECGELAGPADERELFVMVDRSATRIRAFVEELDGPRVAPGQRAQVSLAANPSRSFVGTIRSCSPCLRPKAQYRLKPGERLDIRVREVVIELDDGHDLLVGSPVEVFIEPANRRE